jgi:uncharacterized protein (TIGR03084 family)
MTTPHERLREDLRAEEFALDEVVADISEEQWLLATPSPGWSVADQIAHLTYFDESAVSALTNAERFRTERSALVAHVSDVDEFTLAPLRQLTPRQLLERWRLARLALHDASEDLANDARVEWFGPSMGAKSFLSARLMETWAHGTDVVDALHAARPPTDRLVHIAQLGYNTRRWSYHVRGESVPEGEVRLELTSPSGASWTWGPDVADDTVRGPAEEFCLVVTQRRHLEDTSLAAGELGTHWLQRAQAFAGAATLGPVRSAT